MGAKWSYYKTHILVPLDWSFQLENGDWGCGLCPAPERVAPLGQPVRELPGPQATLRLSDGEQSGTFRDRDAGLLVRLKT